VASLGTSSSYSIKAIAAGTNTVSTGDALTVSGATAAAYLVSTPTPSLISSAVGGTNSIKVKVTDQFGSAVANQALTVAITGRNALNTADTNYITDSSGYVTFTYTDIGTAASTLISDTVTFTVTGITAKSATVNFGAVTVGTVTVTGGASEDTVAYPAVGSTTQAISTAKAGAAAAGTTTFTATVKDANGNLLAGVPVTWTVDKTATAGTTKSTTVDAASCYTTSAGTCTTTVYSWAAPSKVTVTATAGGKTGTGYQNFVNAAGDARVLSATVSGAMAIAKVVDRYGNAVAGVTVAASTSNGYFGSGATSTTGVTAADGTVGFALTGAGTVTPATALP